MPIGFDHPKWLWLLLLAVAVVALGFRSRVALEKSQRWVVVGFRLAVVVIAVVMLAGLQTVRHHRDLTVIAVIDRSESIRRLAQPPPTRGGLDQPHAASLPPSINEWVMQWLERAAGDLGPDDRLGVVTYDGRPAVGSLPVNNFHFESSAIVTPT